MTTTTKPDTSAPVGAVELSDWCDLGTLDAYRTFSGRKRGVGTNSVEATGMQNPDGTVEEVCVRAALDVWEHTFHQHWDDGLSTTEARRWAALLAAASEMMALASAFLAAADEADGWSVR